MAKEEKTMLEDNIKTSGNDLLHYSIQVLNSNNFDHLQHQPKMSSKFVAIAFVFATLLLLFTPSVECNKKRFKFCKVNHLTECFAEPISYFTSQANGTGIAATDEDIEQYCL